MLRATRACCVNFDGGNKLSNVKSFVIFAIGRELNSSNKGNSANFSGEKSTMKNSEVSNFLQYAKIFKSNLVLVVVLVFESKGK